MTHDHSQDEMDKTDMAGAHQDGLDAHSDHGHDDHDHGDSHDAHGAHGEDDSEKSTLVPVTWRQLIFPALIILLVAILLIGPVSAAFAPRPSRSTNTEQQTKGGTGEKPAVEPTHAPGGSKSDNTSAQIPATARPTDTAAVALTAPPPTNTVAPAPPAQADAVSPEAAATRTAVAVLGEEGQVSRAPVVLDFAGSQFAVDAGSGILPDWKPSGDPAHATWIQGTFANHLIYLPYNETNAALFAQAKPGDMVKLTMNNGQVFEFQITRSERASNGPPADATQFTVTTAMNQDHAGVTLFLVGDPATDRAVVQADFTGNIQ